MITRGANLLSRVAVLLAFVFALTSCGGGGGNGAAFFNPVNLDGQIEMVLLDPQGNPTGTVTASSPGTLLVRILAEGNAGLVVSLQNTIAEVFPATRTALTNAEGVATFQIEAGTERGAGTLTATATTTSGLELELELNIQVGETGLRLGRFTPDGTFIENEIDIVPTSQLSASGNAQLSVVVLDSENNRITTSEEVRFNSGCIAAGLATINPENSTTINGQASTLYTATGCTGLDEITASLVGAGAQAFGTMNIASPQANALLFVGAEPELIVLRGTGGENRQETSTVTFRVVDGAGLPLQGVTVNFALTTDVGGIALTVSSALSNGDGEASTIVQSGDVATAARVIATIETDSGNPISTLSDVLTVTTGLPDQNSISLSVSDTFVVPEAMVVDGLLRTLTVRMADKFNNPVVDGTAAVFTTEYGAIVGSCDTVDGACSVAWNSQQPRFPTLTGGLFIRRTDDPVGYDCPDHRGTTGPCPSDLGYTRGGRSRILVHAIGEESFVDSNGNGVMDEAERDLFDNLTEAYVDHNEDGVYTPALPECLAAPMGSAQCIAGQEETFVDFNSNNEYDRNDSPAVYNGLLCPPEGDGVWCSRELVHVWDEAIIVLSSPDWDILMEGPGGSIISNQNDLRFQQSYIAHIADVFNNPPPGGSTVSVSTEGDCDLLSEPEWVVPNTASTGAFSIPVELKFPDELNEEQGVLKIELAPSAGLVYFETWNCADPCSTPFSPASTRPSYCADPNDPPAP